MQVKKWIRGLTIVAFLVIGGAGCQKTDKEYNEMADQVIKQAQKDGTVDYSGEFSKPLVRIYESTEHKGRYYVRVYDSDTKADVYMKDGDHWRALTQDGDEEEVEEVLGSYVQAPTAKKVWQRKGN